jgi:hypothetical protein
LPGNTSAEDITVALKMIDYDVISVKQMTTKRPTSEAAVTHTSLFLFLVMLARKQKALGILKLTKLRNIKVEAYKSNKGVYAMLQLSGFLPHLNALQAASLLPVVCVCVGGGGSPSS